MRQKRLTVIAVGCGLVCAACVSFFMISVQGEASAARAEALARYGGEQVEVCVATRDIAAGERVDLSGMETRLWIADLLPDGAVRDTSEVAGKIAASSILKGEVVSTKRFESPRNALDIPAGKQALSVPAKAVQAVGGAVSPGMAVDVYASGDTTTKPLARDVIVLDTSVGETGSLVSGDSGWITLAIDPENVQEIIAASNATSLYFVIPGAQEQVAGPSGEASDEAARKNAEEAPGQESKASEPQPEEDSGDTASTASEPEAEVE